MASEAVVLQTFRQRIAAHMAGKGTLAPAKYMVFGDGGHNADGSVKPVSDTQTALNHEVLRKELTSVKQEDLLSFTARSAVDKNELVGTVLSEYGIADSNGDLIGIKTFPPKVIGQDESYEMYLRLRF